MKTKILISALLLAATAFGSAGLMTTAIAHEHHKQPKAPTRPKTYRNIRGQVVELHRPSRANAPYAVTLDHENIPNFMRAMRMTMPLRDRADVKKLRKGAKIRFDMVLQGGNLMVANVRLLPVNTKLKLAN